MAVEVLGGQGEVDGYGDSMQAFRSANENNAKVLLNLAEGKTGKNRHEPRPVHDHAHPDNQWPVLMYSPTGDRLVGKSLKGIDDTITRGAITKANKEAAEQAKKDGFRMEPYVKPQIAVLDPAVEKAALQAKINELQGALVSAADSQDKLDKRLAALEKK